MRKRIAGVVFASLFLFLMGQCKNSQDDGLFLFIALAGSASGAIGTPGNPGSPGNTPVYLTVVSASATAADTVRVVFSSPVKTACVAADGSQFSIDNDLTITGAVVNGNEVNLTTSPQGEGLSYTVSVAATVTDADDNGIDPAGNSALFTGYVSPSLIINEIDYDNPSTDTDEFVEIYNPTAGTIDLTGIALALINGSNSQEYDSIDLSSAGSLAPGDYLVVGSISLLSTVPGSAKTITLFGAIQNGGTTPDGVAIVDTNNNRVLDALSYEGEITGASFNLTGIAGTFNLVEGIVTTAFDPGTGVESLSRCPNGSDSNNAVDDWFVKTSSPGDVNICQ